MCLQREIRLFDLWSAAANVQAGVAGDLDVRDRASPLHVARETAPGSERDALFADDSANDRVTVTVAAAGGGADRYLLSTTHPDTVAASPVLGDLIAANGTPAWARLAGQTTATRKFLRQTGNGTISAIPVWDTLVAGDLPVHNHAAGDINSGTLAPARGGAATDLSAIGPSFLRQASTGAAVTVATRGGW